MHIARLQLANSTALARLHPDGTYTKLNGDLFTTLTDTGERITGKLLAPLEPRAILCIGLNYKKHAEETNAPIQKHPVLFFKNPSALQNPGDPILLPRKLRSDKVDYECELAVVIGKTARNVPRERAYDYILGHTCANDGVVEGVKLVDGRAFSVQYHPEAAAGPHDANYLFDQFAGLMESAKTGAR